MTAPIGKRIRGYELREQIGTGGFGTVYRAYQSIIDREVAIKVILPEFANHPDFIFRFEAEAQVIARLAHPHIVPLYDYWREPDGAYLVMRYLPSSLRAHLKKGIWSPEATLRLLEQITAALTIAHRHGVIHRDLKPDNILLDEDNNAYLADFGIAKVLNATATTTGNNSASGEQLVGSPMYITPEQLKNEEITPQTDLYTLGLVLYEMLVGERPFGPARSINALMYKQLNQPLPSLLERCPDLPPELNDVIQQVTAKDPAQRYPDALALAAAFRQALGLPLAASSIIARPDNLVGTEGDSRALTVHNDLVYNPYKGLRAFQEADASDFFGRDALVDRLLKRMAESGTGSRFLAVVGPSGSGKSSVVRAGLIPALRTITLRGSKRWFIVEIIPGAHPVEELASALLRVAASPPDNLLNTLREDTWGLVRAAQHILPGDEGNELVLVIDQFEEVFTLVENQAECAHLLNSLLVAVNDPNSRLRVIITLRADFYDRPLLYAGFSELMRKRTEVVLPLSPAEIEQAIVRPAERIGVTFQTGLVPSIINDIAEQPGALPMLQYALTELFEQRHHNKLTLAAYRGSGGVLGALSRRAEELYAGLNDAEKEAARQLFLRLVTLGEGVEDTRRRTPRSELLSIGNNKQAINHVIDLYSQYRLLTFDRDPVTREPTVEVAHEALIRTWGRLREWLNESREDLRLQYRLAVATAEWINSGRDVSFLATGARLSQFELFLENAKLKLTHDEQTYLEASVAERKARQQRDEARHREELVLQRQAANRLRYLVAVLGTFFFVTAALSVFAFQSRGEAIGNSTRSESLRLAAEANNILQTQDGNAELAALLSLRSLNTVYSPQADATSRRAIRLAYTRQILISRSGAIRNVAMSPDGIHALIVGETLTAQLWDMRSGVMLHEFAAEPEKIASAAFSPDGKTILTGSAKLVASSDSGGKGITARLWSVETATEVQRFTGHIEIVRSVAFSPDGKRILTSSIYPTARLWDVDTGRELNLQTFPDVGEVNTVAFSPDGQKVLTGSGGKSAFIWDANAGVIVQTFEGHEGEVTSVAYSPNGQYILTGSTDQTARLWMADTGTLYRVLSGHSGTVTSVAFSPDSQYVLTASTDKIARLWSIQTGSVVRVFSGHTAPISSAVYSPDGKYILTGSEDQTARLWDAQLGVEARTINTQPGQVNAVAFSPDGKYILTGQADRVAQLWEVATERLIRTFTGHANQITSVAVSFDGKYILTGNRDRTMRLWELATGEELHRFTGHTNWITSVAFSPDARYALSGSYDNTARLWDVTTGKQVRHFAGHTNWVNGVTFSPDGKYILTGSEDQTARLWDTETGVVLHTFTGHTGSITSVAFSPDGKYVLTGSTDKMARLWDATTGAVLRTFTGHADSVTSVAFSSDGKYILTGSTDLTAQVWDAQTGISLRSFSDHTDRVKGVAFSPDGKVAISGSADKTVRLWNTNYHDWISLACGRVWRDLTDDERVRFDIGNKLPTCPQHRIDLPNTAVTTPDAQ